MEPAIRTMVGVFEFHSRGKDNLGPEEFRKLLQELKNAISDTDNRKATEQMRNHYKNREGKITFKEYLTVIGDVAKNNHASKQ